MSSDLESRREMVVDFVTESRELLDNIEPQIIELEKHAALSGDVDDEVLNNIFRLFHSVKGMASFVDLQTIAMVTHEAETLLDLFRKRQMTIVTGHVTLLYRTCDFIRGLIDKVEEELTDSRYAEDAASIIGELKQVISGEQRAEAAAEAPEDGPRGSSAGETENTQVEDQGTENLEVPCEFQFDITPEMYKRFTDEAIEIFEEIEAALLELEDNPADKECVERVFRGFHSFKGNAGFFGYSQLEQLSHQAETLLAEIRDKGAQVDGKAISALLAVVDSLREGVLSLNAENGPKVLNTTELEALLREVSMEISGNNSVDPQVEPASPVPESVEQTQGSPESVQVDSAAKDDGLKKDSLEKRVPSKQTAIRVDVDKLDSLLDMVGELVIAESMVSHNPDLQGLQLDRFEKSVLQLTKITRDIQDVSMSLRMIPLAGVFSKMARLVRDLSVKENKKIELEVIGEDTEVDKTIIEQISDPLVHLIRNGADHGLESAEERRAAGKPETGKITLEAKHSAGEVWIVVKDNGKGLNKEKILKKALEKGITKDDNLKDEEILKLIFEPGLSTADKVSSISGRGVGMDVVKRNIEKLRGRIDIRSNPGQGTAFIVRIPLTLAIIEGMVVKVGRSLYTIPIISIRESFRPQPSQITVTPEGSEIVDIRGELLPIIRLHELYRVKPYCEDLDQGILILAESESRKCCLFVDELIGQQQIVIKPLSEYFGSVRGVSGFAILGGGEVSMILDIASLIYSVETMTDPVRLSAAN